MRRAELGMGHAPRPRRSWRGQSLIPTICCLLLAACSAGVTPLPTRFVVPPTLMVITPTIITGGISTAVPPAAAASGAPGGPTVALPARSDPGFGNRAPTQPPILITTTPGPTATATQVTPTSTPDPNAPRARRLTVDGCCPEPRWLPNGESVVYYGTGGPAGATGTWAVPRGGGAARLLTSRYGIISPDGQFIAYPEGQIAHIARLDGTVIASWETNGRVYFAQQGGRVAWFDPAGDVEAASVSLDPPVRVAVGTISTGAAIALPPAFSTERLQWFPDGKRILLSGREGNGNNPGLWVIDATTGAATRIVAGRGLENVAISPDGRQIAYTATLQEERSDNGLWLIDANGGNRRKLPFTGGYRWSPDNTALYYVPLTPNQPTDELWRYLLADGSRTPIISASQVPFQIAQDQWELAPTGDAITYRSATDGAIWVITWVK